MTDGKFFNIGAFKYSCSLKIVVARRQLHSKHPFLEEAKCTLRVQLSECNQNFQTRRELEHLNVEKCAIRHYHKGYHVLSKNVRKL